MKKLLLFLSLLLATNVSALSVFNQCEIKEKVDELNQPPIPLKKEAPKYPRKAQMGGEEGTVLVEYDVNEQGQVINPKIIWSEKEVFDNSALRAVSSWSYKPALEGGKPILYKNKKQLIYFLIEGSENELDLGSEFNNLVMRVKAGLRKGKVEGIIKRIDTLLARENLDEMARAGILYLKAMSLYKVKAPNEEIKNLLLESKRFYEKVVVEFNSKSTDIKSVTSMKLQTFGGILLGQMYFEESNWEKTEKELSEAIRASLDSGLKSQRFYTAYLQLGIASYNQKKWCLAAKSWEKAQELARVYKITFPDQLSDPLKYAQSQIQFLYNAISN